MIEGSASLQEGEEEQSEEGIEGERIGSRIGRGIEILPGIREFLEAFFKSADEASL